MEELSGVYYRPRTRETKSTYEILLSFIQKMIGDQVCTRMCDCALEPTDDKGHLMTICITYRSLMPRTFPTLKLPFLYGVFSGKIKISKHSRGVYSLSVQ